MRLRLNARTVNLSHSLRAARIVLIISIVASMLTAPVAARASHLPSDQIVGVPLSESPVAAAAPDISAAAGVVMGPDGRILWARDASGRRAQASTTKVMTALLVLERANLDASVYVSKAAASVPYATGLVAGERRTVRELLQMALVASSNDAAFALAEHVAGSHNRFVSLMNQRAAELGLTDTHFVNPHGLDFPGHYSSAIDIATLAKTAMKLPEFRRIVALSAAPMPGLGTRPPQSLSSTDRKLGGPAGFVGIKTGFTDDAKFCLVASAQRNGAEYTVVILGAPASQVRFNDTARLLDWATKNFTYRNVTSPDATVHEVPVAASSGLTVPLKFAGTATAPLFRPGGDVAREIIAPPAVDLPVFAGQLLGEARLTQAGSLLATVPLVAATDIASAEETVGAVRVTGYARRSVTARAAAGASDVPEFDPKATIERTVSLASSVRAPVRSGDQIGVITYAADGKVIVEVPVVAAETIEAPGALERTGAWFVQTWERIVGRSSTTVAMQTSNREWALQPTVN